MLQLEEARELIIAAVRVLPAEMVPLREAAGRFLAHDVAGPIDLPVFDNSAMDGYAVHSDDLRDAAADRPVRLSVSGQIAAGTRAQDEIGRGSCARIFTGAPLPPGVDAVVMQEEVTHEGEHAVFREAVKPWENVRFRGEDVKAGAILARSGDRVNAATVAALGALGLTEVSVHRRPIVGLLATGDELQEPGTTLSGGQIYESNRAALAALLQEVGAVPRTWPIVADRLDACRAALGEALAQCDFVVTTGGVSVGAMDFVKEAFDGLGGKLDFWRVAIRPGKPFVFGTAGEKLMFGLPGNPVSSFVTALLLVWPALLRSQGANTELPSHSARAAEALVNRSDRRHFMRVRVDAGGNAWPVGLQASHAVASLAAANALVDVPAGTVIERGAEVRALRFG
jgi:molybdopterin molybdotransferase